MKMALNTLMHNTVLCTLGFSTTEHRLYFSPRPIVNMYSEDQGLLMIGYIKYLVVSSLQC